MDRWMDRGVIVAWFSFSSKLLLLLFEYQILKACLGCGVLGFGFWVLGLRRTGNREPQPCLLPAKPFPPADAGF
jgi:hypothetical protein